MAEDNVVDYVDESLRNHTQRFRSFYNDNDGSTVRQNRCDENPEDLMNAIEDCIGDALARVTVSGDLSSSHEFHGAKSFVSISVACNNHMDDINTVHDFLRPVVAKLCYEDHEEMSFLRDEILPPSKRQHAQEQKSPPAKEKVSRPPKRGSKVVTPKGAKKPSFRR